MKLLYEATQPLVVQTPRRKFVVEPGETLRLPPEKAEPLVKAGKLRVVDPPKTLDPVEMIGQVIKEIEGFYASGALKWARTQRPDLYRRMEALEREIDQLARARALGILKVRLEQWRELIGKVVRDYLFQNSNPTLTLPRSESRCRGAKMA